MSWQDLERFDFRDKTVTVVGLGIEGVDMARYLSRQGACVTISDSKPQSSLQQQVAAVQDLPVNLALGSDQSQPIEGAEVIFVSQGVPLDLPALAGARRRGIPLGSLMGLFLELCPGPMIGITGSSGKTTTTALVGRMFEADERPVFVGGNIGVAPLERLPEIRPYTWSVLEVSHTQLQLVQRSPHIAALLNLTPNHLDRFSWDEYRQLKANILRFQTANDIAVLNRDDPEVEKLAPLVKGKIQWFSTRPGIPGDAVFVQQRWAVRRVGRKIQPLFPLDSLRLRGAHNCANAVAAAAIACAAGVSPEAIACAVESFGGVPHRLELVGDANGVRFYNDSIATTPERTLAGIRSFNEPLVLLLGGRHKNLPLDELVAEASRRCRAVVLFGEAAGTIAGAFAKYPGGPLVRVETLQAAVDAATRAAMRGDVVLLSPACTSYDAYDNFERRGEHFRSLVQALMKEVQPSRR